MIVGEKAPTRSDLDRERAAVRFAWLPRRLSDGRWAWLERVVVVERVDWARRLVHGFPAGIYPAWRRTRVARFDEFVP